MCYIVTLSNLRKATVEDLENVKTFIDLLKRKSPEMLEDFNDSITNNESKQTYILFGDTAIVGLIIIRADEEFKSFQKQYSLVDLLNINDFSYSCALILHALISPIFQKHNRFFLREIHRLSGYTLLNYRIHPTTIGQLERTNIPNVITELVPVKPLIESDILKEDSDNPSDPFALFLMTMPWCRIKKLDINRKIVIIGCSTTALAFLENMVYGEKAKYLNYTNLTLVSPFGFPFNMPPSPMHQLFSPYDGHYKYESYHKFCFPCYTNIVIGYMTRINRQEKNVVINDNYIIPYDYLILTCGLQFQIPTYLMKRAETKPMNVFVINNSDDVFYAMTLLQTFMIGVKQYQILVYGSAIEAYCCVKALMEIGIPGSNIIFIDPYPLNCHQREPNCFNNEDVEDFIKKAMINDNIRLYECYKLVSWEWDVLRTKIIKVKLESRLRFAKLACLGIFMFLEKIIDHGTQETLTTSGLITDGLLVIDNKFRTNDPYIFAAGPMTKYPRQNITNYFSHRYFSSYEIGKTLAEYMHWLIDPESIYYKKVKPQLAKLSKNELLHCRCPVVLNCVLPGGFNYLSVRRGGPRIFMQQILSREEIYGTVYVTGSMDLESKGYFLLHLNTNQIVEKITCLSYEKIDVQNTIKLWGQHEQLLNNFKLRFEDEQILDLYDYFRQPWTVVIYHECFIHLQHKVQKIFREIRDPIKTTYEKIIDLLSQEETSNEDFEIGITTFLNEFNNSIIRTRIIEELLKFIKIYHLDDIDPDKYFKSETVKNSPLFS